MTLENLLQIAKESFHTYISLARDNPSEAYHWNACICGVRRMTIDSIDWFGETVSKDELDEAYDALDEAYDQARKDIDYIYREAVCNDD